MISPALFRSSDQATKAIRGRKDSLLNFNISLRTFNWKAMLGHQLQVVFPRRNEDVDAAETGRRAAAMRHVRRMDADIAGFHQEGFITAGMLFRTFQNDQDLHGLMAVDREYASGRIGDEAEQGGTGSDKARAGLFRQRYQRNILDRAEYPRSCSSISTCWLLCRPLVVLLFHSHFRGFMEASTKARASFEGRRSRKGRASVRCSREASCGRCPLRVR